MLSFLLWYLLSTLLGWLTFPLAYRLFPALKDRGYTLSRAFGLLLWGYIFWLFASFRIAQNDIGGLLLGYCSSLSGLSAWAISNLQSLILVQSALRLLDHPILSFLKSNRPSSSQPKSSSSSPSPSWRSSVRRARRSSAPKSRWN
jgi:hypothetical protein